MIEIIFSFTIFCTIVSFLPIIFRTILNPNPIDERIQRMEWEVFISQLKMEIQSCDFISGGKNQLVLINDGHEIIFEKYGTNIRRKVDNEGHEIMLQRVRMVEFEQVRNGMTINVEDMGQKSYSSTIYSLIELEPHHDV